MTDTITVRDHSQPCEHGFLGDVGDANQRCNWYKWCPGGREITLRLIGNQKAGRVWVEVGND